MRTRYALAFYYLVIGLLAACAVIIIIKLLLFPPCTPTGPHGSLCAVDGWSIAGLAATVLGVAAAILTILGAFSVAYWWAELDKRVNSQVRVLFEEEKKTLNKNVDELLDAQKATIKKEMENLLKDQKTTISNELEQAIEAQKIIFDEALQKELTILNKKVDDLLEVQRKKIEAQEQQLSHLDKDLDQMQALADTIIDLTLSVAAINPPWQRESWARDISARFKTAEIPKHMALNYLNTVDEFLTQPANNMIFFTRSLRAQNAPSDHLNYYWDKALEWEHILEEYYGGVIGEPVVSKDGTVSAIQVPEPLRIVREKVNEYRPRVEEWKSQHRQLSST